MMIEFHVLETNNSQQAWLFVCNLLEKYYLANRRAYLVMETREQAERFDQLLWTYRDDSFIPHCLQHQQHATQSPIIIGHEPPLPETPRDLVINLSQQIPHDYHEFQHLIEIVINEPLMQQQARERYKFYRDQKHQINTIK
jgi:DNA polymerase-3 subunit chi